MNVTDLGLFDLDYLINKMYNKFSFFKKNIPAFGGGGWFLASCQASVTHAMLSTRWTCLLLSCFTLLETARDSWIFASFSVTKYWTRFSRSLVVVVISMLAEQRCASLWQPDSHFSLECQTNKPLVIHPDFHRPSRHACFYFIIQCMHEKFINGQ